MNDEGAFHGIFKVRESKKSETINHEDVKKNFKDRFEHDSCNEFKKADLYVRFKHKFVYMLSDIEWRLDGHLCSVCPAEQATELAPEDVKTIHSATYLVGSKADMFDQTRWINCGREKFLRQRKQDKQHE